MAVAAHRAGLPSVVSFSVSASVKRRRGCTCSTRPPPAAAAALSLPLGVRQVRPGGGGPARFHATLHPEGIALGCFASAEEAGRAWDAAARRAGRHVTNTCAQRASGPAATAASAELQRIRRVADAGFPYPPTDSKWREAELAAFLAQAGDATPGVGRVWVRTRWGEALQQDCHSTAPGNALCFSFNPHIFTVCKARDCRDGWDARPSHARESMTAAWARNEFRLRCARAVVESAGPFRDGEALRAALRKQCCMLSGAWVLNFQPLLAAALYARFGGAGCTVLDPCGGWGGRLLGAVAAKVGTYICCEPSTGTHAGLAGLAKLAATAAREGGTRVQLMRAGAEETRLPPGSVDLAFTSPPYFNLELYSNEPTQSHIKFPTSQWWTDAFLAPLCANAHHALRPGGYLLLNVAGNALLREAGLMLEEETSRCAIQAGFNEEQRILMLKPTAAGGPAADLSASEPILVFRKPMRGASGAEDMVQASAHRSEAGAHDSMQPGSMQPGSMQPGSMQPSSMQPSAPADLGSSVECAGASQLRTPNSADQRGLEQLLDGW